MRNPIATSSVLLTVMFCACGGEDAGNDGSTTSVDEATSTGTGEEPTTGEPPFVAIPARGDIKITRVEANSGVAVPIDVALGMLLALLLLRGAIPARGGAPLQTS